MDLRGIDRPDQSTTAFFPVPSSISSSRGGRERSCLPAGSPSPGVRSREQISTSSFGETRLAEQPRVESAGHSWERDYDPDAESGAVTPTATVVVEAWSAGNWPCPRDSTASARPPLSNPVVDRAADR